MTYWHCNGCGIARDPEDFEEVNETELVAGTVDTRRAGYRCPHCNVANDFIEIPFNEEASV